MGVVTCLREVAFPHRIVQFFCSRGLWNTASRIPHTGPGGPNRTMSAARQALKAIAMKKELQNMQADSAKAKAKASRRDQARAAKRACKVLQAVHALEETDASQQISSLPPVSHSGSFKVKMKEELRVIVTEAEQGMIERAEQRLARGPEWSDTPPQERARKLAEQTCLPTDLVIAFLTTKAPDEYGRIKRGRAAKSAAKVQGLKKMIAINHVAHAAKQKGQDQEGNAALVEVGDTKPTAAKKLGKIVVSARNLVPLQPAKQKISQEDPTAPDEGRKHSDPLPRAASMHPVFLSGSENDPFLDDYLRNQLVELNRGRRQPYQIDRTGAGPAFSCKAHFRHRTGHFSFSLLASLGARKRSREETAEHTLPALATS